MLDPYKMVLINLIAFLLLTGSLLFYKFVYPKKNIDFLVIVLLYSLLPLISLLRAGAYESGDMSINVYKSMAFYKNLLEGIILPRWAGELNATYGYPLFIFTYPLPYYIVSLFHFIGFSFISSIKLLIAVTFLISGVAMYLWSKEEFGNNSAIVAAIFYLYAPYHLVDIHFRISLGEIVAFALIPLCLLFIKKLTDHQHLRWYLLSILTISLLLLCNPAISSIAIPFLIIYSIFSWALKKKKKKQLLQLVYNLSSFIFSISLTTFYWIPVVFESKYTHQPEYAKSLTYVNLPELLYSPWRFGLLFQGPKGELSFLIGYIQILIIAIIVIFLLKGQFNKLHKKKAQFYLLGFIIMTFMMLSVSSFIWETFSFLHNFQFTYRLLLFTALFTSILAGIAALKLNNKLIIILCLVAVLQTILNWGNRRTIPEINDVALRRELPSSTYQGEGFQPATPKWVNIDNPWQKKIPNAHLDILEGNAHFLETKRTTTQHEYIINVSEATTFKENTIYYPCWTASANNKVIPIDYENKKYPGIITFQLKKGLYKLTINFFDTPLRAKANIISFITFVILSILLVYSTLRKKILNK